MTREGFHDIEVMRDEHREVPSLRVSGQAGARAVKLGAQRWLVSLTHTDTLAQATVLLTG